MKPNALPQSNTRHAVSGMLWISIAIVFSKSLSFLSQIVLGHLLSVETYAIFGLSTTALALVSGFQNASTAKALIQNQDRFDELFPSYSAFTFQFGLVGAFLLVVIAGALQQIYQSPGLFLVLCLTSVSIPFLANNTVLVAALSVQFRFKEININDIRRSFVYYGVLISAALFGSGVYTMAIATVFGAIASHVLLRRISGARPAYFRLRLREFLRIFHSLRWVLLSGFLVALAMRADYFVVGKLVSAEELGFYTFGFMLVASLTMPISQGINQVLLPIFAQLQTNQSRLREDVLRYSSVIIIAGSVLCLLISGLSSVAIHQLWGSKWERALVVINALLAVMPFRFLATISGVGFESIGQWRSRNLILSFEVVVLAVCAYIGVQLAGIEGAIIGVIFQRALSGLIGFSLFGRCIGISAGKLSGLMTRLYSPYLAACALLFLLSPMRHGEESGTDAIGFAAVETLTALVLYGALAFWWNSKFILFGIELIRVQLKKVS